MTRDNTYRCEHCGGRFEKIRLDGEVEAEYRAEFPEMDGQEAKAVVCEVCYRAFMAWRKQTRSGPAEGA